MLIIAFLLLNKYRYHIFDIKNSKLYQFKFFYYGVLRIKEEIYFKT